MATQDASSPPIPFADTPNLARLFFDQAERCSDQAFLWKKQRGAYVSINWQTAADETARLALGLRDLGIGAGDRVVLVAENSPQWLMADIAIMTIGAISVPAYTTNTAADHRHILKDSGAKAAFVSGKTLAACLMEAAADAPALEMVIGIECRPVVPEGQRIKALRWPDVLSETDDPFLALRPIIKPLQPSDTACIIYTSGTGGTPKGVVLSHRAILHNCAGAYHFLLKIGLDDQIFLSFLPLSHAYEHTAGQFFPIAIGAQIYYAEGIDKLATNMVEARPTIMTAVPRLYETLHARISQGVKRQGGVKAALFDQAVALGRKRLLEPGSLNIWEKLLDRLLDRLVRRKVAARFGGRLKALVSGGAPLNPEIGYFFQALGLRILQGYGQTEAGPVISCNPPDRVKIETVGPPLHGVTVRIAEDGEILVQGDNLMQGYWNNPQASAATLRDGWLHTGDIGTIDADGYIQITDRKKDIIVNAGGDNIAPQKIEGVLVIQPEIGQAMIYGDRKPYLSAVLVPDPSFLQEWQAKTDDASDQALTKRLAQVVELVNGDLSAVERIRRFIIADEPFGIDNGLMTPTMKIRRHKITQRYQQQLEALYR